MGSSLLGGSKGPGSVGCTSWTSPPNSFGRDGFTPDSGGRLRPPREFPQTRRVLLPDSKRITSLQLITVTKDQGLSRPRLPGSPGHLDDVFSFTTRLVPLS